MKDSTPYLIRKKARATMVLCFFMLAGFVQAQMYGDTIFWESFNNGTGRSDIIGLGKLGGMYKYEGPINYVYAINPQKLSDYMTANPAKTYVTDAPTFHDVPILTSDAMYSYKPSSPGPAFTSDYFIMSSWRNRTFSAVQTGDTETLSEWDDTFYTYATGYETQIPAAWIWVDDEWRFGFYNITYENTSRCTVPDDGHYAIIENLDVFNCGGADVNWLFDDFGDHTGLVDDTTSPIAYNSARVATGDDSRMIFINCAAVTGISSPVYKRLVPELCRDSWFEFSIWYAAVHTSVHNGKFRIEFWSSDPGNDPSLGDLTSADEGQVIEKAENAYLYKIGDTTPLGVSADVGKWFQIKETFKLTDQDHVWVVVRNYGEGGTGNDIVLDDLVFKPWAPFNLDVELSASSLNTACVDGIITMLSNFPAPETIPGYVDIQEYAFYFEGYDSEGEWRRLGNEYPLQTQSVLMPLELTIPISEYVLYSKFRISVATKATGFGGKCVTFTQTPTVNVPIPSVPAFNISGDDVCDDSSGTQQGFFKVKNVNQTNCEGWSVKVRMPDGSLEVFTPDTQATCP